MSFHCRMSILKDIGEESGSGERDTAQGGERDVNEAGNTCSI